MQSKPPATPERKAFILFTGGTKLLRQSEKMPPMTIMKNKLKNMRHGKNEKFMLCNGLHARCWKFCQNVSRNKLNHQIVEKDGREKRQTKNEPKIIQRGKRGGFILCAFRTGLPGTSAKVGDVGDIHVVQWMAQAEPEFLPECQPKT
jgi:hypothetical protein